MCVGNIPTSIGMLSNLTSLYLDGNKLSGKTVVCGMRSISIRLNVCIVTSGFLPIQLCSMSLMSVLYIWNDGGLSANPYIFCTLSCLSMKSGMSFAPLGLSQCPSTPAAQTPTDIGLCAIVAATNIAVTADHSMWHCTSAGIVSTPPCNGATSMWVGVQCDIFSTVRGLNLDLAGLAGKREINIL